MAKKKPIKKMILIALIVVGALVFIHIGKQIFRIADIVKAYEKVTAIVFRGDFDPPDYEWGIEHFPSDKVVDPIYDANTAGEIAEDIWKRKWGTDGNPGHITEVYYDEETGYWLVAGTVPQEWYDNWILGAIPFAIFHESGDVIAIWKE